MAKGKYEYWLTPEGLIKLEGWARDGLTDEQIAQNVGISRSTLNAWKTKYSDISDTLKRGKEYFEKLDEYMNKYRFEHPEATDSELMLAKEQFPQTKMILSERKVKEVVPDVTAQIFWLKNRKPDKWREKQEIEVSQPIDDSIKEMQMYFEQQKKAGP